MLTLSDVEVIRNFGNFVPYLDAEGKPSIFWEEEEIKKTCVVDTYCKDCWREDAVTVDGLCKTCEGWYSDNMLW